MIRFKGQGPRVKAHGALLYVLLVSCTLFLASCGFHPRGAYVLPQGAEKIYISGIAPSAPLARDITMLYTQAGGTIVEDRNEAEAVLDILGEKNDRRVAAVNSAGFVSQYELYYELRFRLLDLQGEIIHPEGTVGVTRDYAFDPTNILGKTQEEGLLRDDMRRAAIGQMLRRLARGTHLKPDSGNPVKPDSGNPDAPAK